MVFFVYYSVDNNTRGCYAEYKFATMAMESNLRVSMPLLDSSPYDCIVELPNGKLKKIQIKSTNKNEHPRGIHITLRYSDISYTTKEVDYFAIWINIRKGFYIIKNNGKMAAFRISKNGKYSKNFNNFAEIV